MVLLTNRDHEERPWGFFDRFTLNNSSTVKVVNIRPLQKLSLQSHAQRSEFWYILTGSGKVMINDAIHLANVSDEFEIPVGVQHRATAGDDGLSFLEISFGEFAENDETRHEDDYGRKSPTA